MERQESRQDVPMDNNRAEQAIRPFTLGRKNWVNVNSVHGARVSAILYSLMETIKANNLRVYEYPEYLLDELTKHADDTIWDLLKKSPSLVRGCPGKMPQPEKWRFLFCMVLMFDNLRITSNCYCFKQT